MDKRHTEGQICEVILSEYLLRQNMWVYRPQAAFGPADVIAVTKDGDIHLFDAKKDNTRFVPERRRHHRIHRVLSETQKLLGVRMAYVDVETREVHIVPPLEEPAETEKS
jgi:hypothetical protein